MSERDALTPDEQRARDAVRSLDRPRPAPEFRARLREQFTSGTLESAAPALIYRIPWHRHALTRWGAVAVSAAAAVLIVALLNRAPAWTLEAVRGQGIVLIDGSPVPAVHGEELARRLRSGAFVQLPAGVELEIASRGQIAVQLTAGTHASVPSAPGRWFARRASGEVRSGEIRVTTGAGFRGAELAIETPEARVEVHGTTFAVICEPAGTCVCVMEGELAVGTRGGQGMTKVPAGRRRYVFADGRPEESAEMRHTEHAPLGDFRDRMNPEMGGGR